MPSPPSFRRFLFARILLVLLPVLGLSGWIAYAKTRHTLISVPIQSGPVLNGDPNIGADRSSDLHSLQYLLVQQGQAEAALRDLAWIIGGMTALAMGMVTLLSVYLARAFAQPGERLQTQMLRIQRQLEQVSIGLEAPAPLDIETFKVREFQQLAQTFNQLMEGLNQRTEALEQASQQAQSACQMKSQFLAATSHELRTPLNSIIGHIHLIQDGCCDNREEELDCLAQANQAALHLLHVMNELLDIARIEAGEFELHIETLDLIEVLNEVFQLQRPSLEQKDLALELELLAEPVWVEGDRAKLKQVLLNVLHNAIKFTDRGQITVTLESLAVSVEQASISHDSNQSHPELPHPEQHDLETKPSAAEIQHILLRIADTGIGIEPQKQQELFQPFARVSNTSARKFEGTGLGLVISRSILERMGGEIQLSSPGLGQGSEVAIQLPLLSQCQSQCQSQDQSQDQLPSQSSQPPSNTTTSESALSTSSEPETSESAPCESTTTEESILQLG